MIKAIIHWSVLNRLFVLLAAFVLVIAGLFSLRNTPVDAIPDLSDVQVIIKTNFPGQAPQVVEDQVTYPLTTAMLSVPGAVTVRGYSFFGDSYVYVIFDEDTDLYWARSRVLEYLSQVAPSLPAAARPQLNKLPSPPTTISKSTSWHKASMSKLKTFPLKLPRASAVIRSKNTVLFLANRRSLSVSKEDIACGLSTRPSTPTFLKLFGNAFCN